MLSIGKIGNSRGQQLYYEQQVAGGREDYYAGKGEAPGRWAGRGSGTLGLVGELDAVQLAAALEINTQRIQAGLPPVTLLSADAELNAAALAEGLAVDNPNDHP